MRYRDINISSESDDPFVNNMLVGKLDRRGEVHEIAEEGETPVFQLAPDPDKRDRQINSANHHPLVCGEFSTSCSPPIRWSGTHPRRQHGELRVIPHRDS